MGTYARQGKLIAKPGQRTALADALLSGSDATSMPGCQLYLVGTINSEPDAILVTEIWDDETSHRGSLALPSVRAAIQRAMPLIANVEGEAMTLLAGWPPGPGPS